MANIKSHYYPFSGLNVEQYPESMVYKEFLPYLSGIYSTFQPVFAIFLPTVGYKYLSTGRNPSLTYGSHASAFFFSLWCMPKCSKSNNKTLHKTESFPSIRNP